MSRAGRATRRTGSTVGGRRRMRRRAVLVAVGLGVTGCIGSQDDENPGQAEGNTTENETGSVENTSDEETTAEKEEGEPDNEYTDVEDDVYAVESVGSGEYRITADDGQLVGNATPSWDIMSDDEDTAELLHVSDGNPEIYSNGITEEGNAVVFYDEEFANEEPIHFYATWTRGADHPEVDEFKKKVIHENTPLPDAYVDKVGNSLYKATVPLDDLYSDWDDLKEGAAFVVTIGHAKDAVVEKGEDIQFDEDGTNYKLGLSNKAEESNS